MQVREGRGKEVQVQVEMSGRGGEGVGRSNGWWQLVGGRGAKSPACGSVVFFFFANMCLLTDVRRLRSLSGVCVWWWCGWCVVCVSVFVIGEGVCVCVCLSGGREGVCGCWKGVGVGERE